MLRALTSTLLDSMEESGWWYKGTLMRTRPCAWDINNGWCEEWAEAAVDVVGGHLEWLDAILGVDPLDISHCVLVLDGRFYDAQNPEGVDHVRNLAFMRKVPRKHYLGK